jgi:hypothetical protein
VNFFDFNINLSNFQWVGVAIVALTMTLMSQDRQEETLAGVEVDRALAQVA